MSKRQWMRPVRPFGARPLARDGGEGRLHRARARHDFLAKPDKWMNLPSTFAD
jgi:hypothetical protein